MTEFSGPTPTGKRLVPDSQLFHVLGQGRLGLVAVEQDAEASERLQIGVAESVTGPLATPRRDPRDPTEFDR
jgi:hypothetical protein